MLKLGLFEVGIAEGSVYLGAHAAAMMTGEVALESMQSLVETITTSLIA